MKWLILFILSFNLFASECISKSEQLSGKAKLSYFFWDLYELGLYKDSKSTKMKINYLRDIEAELLNQGWEKGLKDNIKNQEEYQVVVSWLKKHTPSVKKGDCLEITIEDSKVSLNLNGKDLAQNNHRKLASYVLSPWIGEKPVDEDVKEELLGKE
jgi:hypothetical protein